MNDALNRMLTYDKSSLDNKLHFKWLECALYYLGEEKYQNYKATNEYIDINSSSIFHREVKAVLNVMKVKSVKEHKV